MKFTTYLIVACFMLIQTAATAGATTVTLRWPDLLPKLPPIVDPLAKLTFDQRIELETVLWVQQLTDAEKKERPEIVAEAKVYRKKLRDGGVIIEQLVKDYEVFDRKARARGKLVRKDLNGKNVQIDGYLLPLEFSETGETEFLLVPYVGACIHVPPPPPNQIALVTLDKKYKVSELFAPVRITGKIKTKASSAKLFLVDGSADISLGYHIEQGTVQLLK
ncbi:MAG: DUF3299 domain-containing protein [Pseudomonadota bacterium]